MTRKKQGAPPESASSNAAAVSYTVSAPAGHPLDLAPVNSKIVVTVEGAMLATPDRVDLLPASDPANQLPDGAKIQKLSEHAYRATQLRPFVAMADQTYSSARAAIDDFLSHFHAVPR